MQGAWHGPWCWRPADRQSSDIDIRTVVLPSSAQDPVTLGDHLYDDAQAVVEVLKAVEGPAVVVGHSCGATPVTEAAATMGNVKRIIYFTALMQDAGDFVLSLVGGTFPPYWKVHAQPDGAAGLGYFEAGQPLDVLYGDVKPSLARRCVAMLARLSPASVPQSLTQAAWRTVPSTYIRCEEDAALPLALQQAMAAQAQRTLRMRSARSPFLSQPAALAADMLRDELSR
ncbi:alpha/beta hydrolase [Streptomyces cadmiisoli]|uniref:alpha/beta hydrolase n=1 Tax=Streptomyces cadmiisoli TaxID=2184053 RepID=UPI0013A6F357|nr:alpha/beta hydrolase [Streptomyces cadmiisoli]